MGLEQLKITTNIKDVIKEFDFMIEHMNDIVKNPININVNINEIKRQFQEAEAEAEKFKTKMGKPIFQNSQFENGFIDTQSYNQIKARMKDIRDNVDSLAKVKINMDVDSKGVEKIQSAIITYKNDLKQVVTETMGWAEAQKTVNKVTTITPIFRTKDITYSDDIGKQETQELKEQQSLYNDLNKLMTEEFAIKQKLIGQEGKIKEELEGQLQLNKELKASVEEKINSKDMASPEMNNSLLVERTNLLSDLIIAQEKYNIALNKTTQQQNESQLQYEQRVRTAIQKEQEQQNKNITQVNEQIALYKELMNIKLQSLDAKYGSLTQQGGILDEINAIKSALSSLNATNFNKGEINNQFKQLEVDIRSSSSALKNVNQDAIGFFDTVERGALKFAVWMAVSQTFMLMIEGIKQGISDIIEMDRTLATLNITMDTTSKGLSDMVKQINDISIATASDTKSVEEAIKVYANYGESTATIMAKAKEAIMLGNISGLNPKDTTDSIHAIINEFNLAGQDAETTSTHIANSLVAISKNMAMDFGKLCRLM